MTTEMIKCRECGEMFEVRTDILPTADICEYCAQEREFQEDQEEAE